MATWQLQDAKARFSKLIDTAEHEGPQVITRRGRDTAVLVPIDVWQRIAEWQRTSPPNPPEVPSTTLTNAELLAFLQSAPDFEIPARHAERRRRNS